MKCLKRDIRRNCVSIQISGCHELQTTNKTYPAARPQEVVTRDQLENYKICQNLFFKCVTKSNEAKMEKNRSVSIDDLHLNDLMTR